MLGPAIQKTFDLIFFQNSQILISVLLRSSLAITIFVVRLLIRVRFVMFSRFAFTNPRIVEPTTEIVVSVVLHSSEVTTLAPLVRLARLELTTNRLGRDRSIQLNYRRSSS